MLLGGRRPTGDVDFGLVLAERYARFWPQVEAAVAEVADRVCIAVQYSTDIDRWSMIAIPKGKLRTKRYQRIGRLEVRLLDPTCWGIYKLARYLDSDVEDLIAVLRRQKVSSLKLARLCGESLRASPRSGHLLLFRRQVEHFFREHGPEVWRKGFDADRCIGIFYQTAKIPAAPRG